MSNKVKAVLSIGIVVIVAVGVKLTGVSADKKEASNQGRIEAHSNTPPSVNSQTNQATPTPKTKVS